MRRFTLSLLVPLLAVACGSSPAAPSSTSGQSAPRALGYSLSMFSVGETSQGWGSPTSFTLRALAIGETVVVESATLKVVGASGETLAEAALDYRSPGSPDGVLAGDTIAQRFTWATEKGYGTRLDISINVRMASGELRTLAFSYAHPPSRQ